MKPDVREREKERSEYENKRNDTNLLSKFSSKFVLIYWRAFLRLVSFDFTTSCHFVRFLFLGSLDLRTWREYYIFYGPNVQNASERERLHRTFVFYAHVPTLQTL